MRASAKFGLTIVGALALGASSLAAQSAPGPKFSPSIFAGAAIPTGDFADEVKTGYNIGAGLDLSMGMPLSFRGEVDYSGFSAKVGSGNGSVLSGRVDAVVGMASATGPRLYGIGGVGVYHFGSDFQSQSKFGWNIGAGVDLPLGTLAARIEARYHAISTEGATASYIPITFGLRF